MTKEWTDQDDLLITERKVSDSTLNVMFGWSHVEIHIRRRFLEECAAWIAAVMAQAEWEEAERVALWRAEDKEHAPSTGEVWTDAEDAIVLAREGSNAEIAKRLGRLEHAVENRRWYLTHGRPASGRGQKRASI